MANERIKGLVGLVGLSYVGCQVDSEGLPTSQTFLENSSSQNDSGQSSSEYMDTGLPLDNQEDGVDSGLNEGTDGGDYEVPEDYSFLPIKGNFPGQTFSDSRLESFLREIPSGSRQYQDLVPENSGCHQGNEYIGCIVHVDGVDTLHFEKLDGDGRQYAMGMSGAFSIEGMDFLMDSSGGRDTAVMVVNYDYKEEDLGYVPQKLFFLDFDAYLHEHPIQHTFEPGTLTFDQDQVANYFYVATNVVSSDQPIEGLSEESTTMLAYLSSLSGGFRGNVAEFRINDNLYAVALLQDNSTVAGIDTSGLIAKMGSGGEVLGRFFFHYNLEE